jgi:hypothetical protein
MKKFGTPTGAAPGIANENVGFEADGTPGPVIPAAGFDGALCVLVEVFVLPEDEDGLDVFWGVLP